MRFHLPAVGVVPNRPIQIARRIPVQRISSGFHALKVPNFRLFITGQIFSLTGTWMQTTAQDWLVLQLSNSPFALGFVTTLQFLPIMLFSLFGGVLADRLPKRKTLITTQSLLLVQAAIFFLLVATNSIQLWHIYVLAISQGLVNAVDNPVRQAFVAEMVGRDELVNAVALNSMTFNGARIIGPALAGLVIAKMGIAPALFVNAASFIVVIIAMLMMNEQALFRTAVAPHGSAWKRLKEGLSYSWNTPRVLTILIVVAAIGTFGYNFSVILPLISGFVLHTDAQGYGALSSFLGIGSLIAAVSTAYVKELTMRRLMVGAAALSVLLGITAVTPVFSLSAIVLVGLGAAGILFATSANSLLQMSVPDELRGRVMSLHILLLVGSTPIGAFLIGLLSEHLGVPFALLVCAFLCMVGVAGAFIYQRRHGVA